MRHDSSILSSLLRCFFLRPLWLFHASFGGFNFELSGPGSPRVERTPTSRCRVSQLNVAHCSF